MVAAGAGCRHRHGLIYFYFYSTYSNKYIEVDIGVGQTNSLVSLTNCLSVISNKKVYRIFCPSAAAGMDGTQTDDSEFHKLSVRRNREKVLRVDICNSDM